MPRPRVVAVRRLRHRSARPGLVASAIVVTLMTVAGCGRVTTSLAADDPRPVVLTTFTVIADIAREVAGDYLRVVSVTKPGAEIHGYEPTPRDLGRAAGADLILDNGLGLEAWFERFVQRADAPRVRLSRDVEPIMIAGSDHPNPHAWMSPLAVQGYVAVMVEAFSELDPDHAAEYAANGAAYRAQLQDVYDDLVAAVAQIPERARALVTCEGAFSYLARDAGLREAYIWPVNAEQQSTPQRVAAVTRFVKDNDVPAVFCESTVSADSMRRIARSTQAEFGGTLFVDSLSAADGPVPTYLDLIRHDVDLIAAGLGGGAR